MTASQAKRGLHCDPYRHLWSLGGTAVAVYWKLAQVTWNGVVQQYGEYFGSIEMVTDYLGCEYGTGYKAFQALCNAGWLVKKPGNNQFKSKNYQVVAHDDWVKQHPGE